MTVQKFGDDPSTWPEVVSIINSNDLTAFHRSSSQLKRYNDFKESLKSKGNSVFKHVLVSELGWYDPKLNAGVSADDILTLDDNEIKIVPTSEKLFTNSNDIKIVPNHFPYNLESNIVHFCVWSKLPIPNDPESKIGDISTEVRNIIEAYVQKSFVKGLDFPRENLIWFRNWSALQSVKGLSHIHVMMKEAPKSKLEDCYYTPGEPLTEEEFALAREAAS